MIKTNKKHNDTKLQLTCLKYAFLGPTFINMYITFPVSPQITIIPGNSTCQKYVIKDS